jgi:hypothetical protein
MRNDRGAWIIVAILCAEIAVVLITGCYTPGANDPSAADIYNAFPDNGGSVMATNSATVKP